MTPADLANTIAAAKGQCDAACGQEYMQPTKPCRHWKAIKALQERAITTAERYLALWEALERENCHLWKDSCLEHSTEVPMCSRCQALAQAAEDA